MALPGDPCVRGAHGALRLPLLPQHTPLGAPGLYIQTLLPGSPAASDGRLSLGDRILEVNGSSLVGVSYLRYRASPPPPACGRPRPPEVPRLAPPPACGRPRPPLGRRS